MGEETKGKTELAWASRRTNLVPQGRPPFSLCLSFLTYKEEVTIVTSGDGHLRRTHR